MSKSQVEVLQKPSDLSILTNSRNLTIITVDFFNNLCYNRKIEVAYRPLANEKSIPVTLESQKISKKSVDFLEPVRYTE